MSSISDTSANVAAAVELVTRAVEEERPGWITLQSGRDHSFVQRWILGD